MASSLSERSQQKWYEQRKKRIKRLQRVAGICIAIGVLAFIVYYIFFQMNRTYAGFVTLQKSKRADSSSVQYEYYNDQLLKYSKDGASALKLDGEILWNGSYEFQNPKAVFCGKYAAIADIGNKEIRVYNGEDTDTLISTEAVIDQIAIANQGVVAAVLENDDEAKINVYDPYDVTSQLKVSISTSTDSDGYPVAIALSEDGQKLVSSYVNISGGVVSGSLNFYNFDSVGKSNVDRIVGSRPMDQTIVADVQFINKDTVCAFVENGFYLYSMSETPKDIANVTVKQTIKSVCYNEKYIALVLENSRDLEHPLQLQVYDTSGDQVLKKNIAYEYDTVEMGEDEVIFYSSTDCNIVRIRGSEKLKCNFEESTSYVFPKEKADTYVLIDADTIREVKLTGRTKGE